jgi:hypothetical protein
MGEVRNAREGTLRWVRASGSGVAWATASAATGTGGTDTGAWGTIGYVTNFRFTSGQTIETVSERGTPTHNKLVSREAPTVTFDVQWGVTAQYPDWTLSGSGASVPMIHLELESKAPEAGAGKAIYHQFMGVVKNSNDFSEGATNTQTWNLKALAMSGPTGSGYLGSGY